MKKYSVLELVEARKMIEMEIVKLAVARGDDSDIEYIREMYDETLMKKSTPVEFIKADFSFHMAIATASKNRYLAEMLSATRELLLEINTDVIRKPGQIDKAIRTHENILDAIEKGNVKAALKEMNSHINMVSVVMGEIDCEKGGACISEEMLLNNDWQ